MADEKEKETPLLLGGTVNNMGELVAAMVKAEPIIVTPAQAFLEVSKPEPVTPELLWHLHIGTVEKPDVGCSSIFAKDQAEAEKAMLVLVKLQATIMPESGLDAQVAYRVTKCEIAPNDVQQAARRLMQLPKFIRETFGEMVPDSASEIFVMAKQMEDREFDRANVILSADVVG